MESGCGRGDTWDGYARDDGDAASRSAPLEARFFTGGVVKGGVGAYEGLS